MSGDKNDHDKYRWVDNMMRWFWPMSDITPYQAAREMTDGVKGPILTSKRPGTLIFFLYFFTCIGGVLLIGYLARIDFKIQPNGHLDKVNLLTGLYIDQSKSVAQLNFVSSLSVQPTSVRPFSTSGNFYKNITKNVFMDKRDENSFFVSSGRQSVMFRWDGDKLTETYYSWENSLGSQIFSVNREEALSVTVDGETIVAVWISGKGLYVWLID